MTAAPDLNSQPLDEQQAGSLNAIMSHVAFRTGIRAEEIRAMLEKKFGVDHYSKITQADYRKAIEFLVDMSFEEIRSKK